jgi:hypothetical protein
MDDWDAFLAAEKILKNFTKQQNKQDASRNLISYLEKEDKISLLLVEDIWAAPLLYLMHVNFTEQEFEKYFLFQLNNHKWKSEEELGYDPRTKIIESGNTPLIMFLYKNGIIVRKNFTIIRYNKFPEFSQLQYDMENNLKDKGIVHCYIEKAPLKQMLNCGFVPCIFYKKFRDKDIKKAVEYYYQNFNDDEIEYWAGIKNFRHWIQDVGIWTLITKKYADASAEKGDSYPLILHFSSMLYDSNRPKTTMSNYQVPYSNRYYGNIKNIDGLTLPVTRYSSGMSKGLYYEKTRSPDICGRFYYYEPQSQTKLSYETLYKTFNKTTCMREFADILSSFGAMADMKNELLFILEKTEKENPLKITAINNHIDGIYNREMKFSPDEASELGLYKSTMNFPDSQKKVYLDGGVYAFEDKYDQILCKIGSTLGYDIIIFESIIGSHQAVTEVLDTRTDSFSHLWFP